MCRDVVWFIGRKATNGQLRGQNSGGSIKVLPLSLIQSSLFIHPTCLYFYSSSKGLTRFLTYTFSKASYHDV